VKMAPADPSADGTFAGTSPQPSEVKDGACAATPDAAQVAAAPALKFKHRRTLREVLRAKRLERSDIKPSDWGKFGYGTRDDVLTRPIEYDEQTVPIERISAARATPQWFFENYSKQQRPVIIEGGCAHWPAMTRWGFDELEERYRHKEFKVGEDGKGKKIKIKFKYFLDYMRNQTDDNPLYLFETEMDDNVHVNSLTEDFQVPDIFPDDYLNLMNHDSRPPHRWWCIGPKRSGTTVHTDPLGTSAWNAVTHGRKHWVLFEPETSKKVAKGKLVKEKSEDDEAIMYFDFLLPRIKKRHPEVRVYQGLQNPGDIIFVPGRWWHGVLNTEDCVAVTQNYCGLDNFEVVWKSIRRDREKVAHLWLRNMRKFAPQLHRHALDMNAHDKFRMRHERRKGERLQDASSSSSDSTDSSTDEATDVRDAPGIASVTSPEILLLGSAGGGCKRQRRQPGLVQDKGKENEMPSKRVRPGDAELPHLQKAEC